METSATASTEVVHEPLNPAPAAECPPSPRPRWRALVNLLRMGHCAPAVMQTLLEMHGRQGEWLVKLTAGLPGGIANTGFECGGVTAALVQLGLDHGLGTDPDGVPTVVAAGHDYCQRFASRNRSLDCHDILGTRRVPLPCIKAVCRAPGLYQATARSRVNVMADETRAAYRLLHEHLSGNGFHCAHAVLGRLGHTLPLTQELLDGTSGFMGGTAFRGRTCSALAAGVMAVGLQLGEIERSLPRVARMLATMVAGGDALADDLNKFNRIVKIGNRLAEWFTREYGSTLCGEVTKCDFSTCAGVQRFIDDGSVASCRTIAQRVAEQVAATLATEAARMQRPARPIEPPPAVEGAGR